MLEARKSKCPKTRKSCCICKDQVDFYVHHLHHLFLRFVVYGHSLSLFSQIIISNWVTSQEKNTMVNREAKSQ